MNKEETETATDESGKPKYFLSFRRVIVYDLLFALIAGILIFVGIFYLSMERLAAQNRDHLYESVDAIDGRLEKEEFQNDLVREAYKRRMNFVLYEYEALRDQKDQLTQGDYEDILSPYENLSAALADKNGNIIHATDKYEKSNLLKTFDKSADEAVFEYVNDARLLLSDELEYQQEGFRKIDDNLWVFFQIRNDDEMEGMADWFDFEAIVETKTTDDTSLFLTNVGDDRILYSLKDELDGDYLFENPPLTSRVVQEDDRELDERVVYDRDRFYLATGTVDEALKVKVWCLLDLSVPLLTALKRTILLFLCLLLVMILESAYIYYNRQYLDAHLSDPSYSSSAVKYKTMIVGLLGMIIMGAFAYYVDTLYSISTLVIAAEDFMTETSWAISDSKVTQDIFLDTWKYINLQNTSILSEYLVNHPDRISAEEFRNLSSIFNLEYMMLFGTDGKEQFSSNSYTGFTLDDIEGVSFIDMVKGRRHMVSDLIVSEWSEKPIQVAGYQMMNDLNESQGILVTVYDATLLEISIENSGLSYLISESVSTGDNAVFVVDTETKKFLYGSDKNVIGMNVADYGYDDSILVPYYTGYLNIYGREYYVTSRSLENALVYIGSEYFSVFYGRWGITLTMALTGLLLFGVLLFIMRKDRGKSVTVYCEKGKQPVINPMLLDRFYSDDNDPNYMWFTKKPSYGIEDLSKMWQEAVPETKVTFILRGIMGITAAVILYYYFRSDRASSIIAYSLNIDRGGGFNIFAATSILVIVIFGMIAVSLICLILDLLSLIMKSRGETICRLIKSSVELFSILLIFYVSLARLGFDIKTLVASAGLMALVIGMGARDLITDILAGLFIIFEGDFQVGDIVEVGGYMGMVWEIGIRTTKIISWTKNVKIINNRSLTSVMNLTNRNSFAMISFAIPNSVNLPHLAEVLNRELKEIRKKYPQMLDDPIFKGVHALQRGVMECRVCVEVAERFRGETEDILNWEIKEILERNEIPLA